MARKSGKTAPDLAAAILPRGDISAQAAAEAQEITNANKKVVADKTGVLVALPQGGVRDSSFYTDAEYFSDDHTAIFADPHAYMKEVHEGSLYVWAAKKDPHTLGRKRAGYYRPVGIDEIREDTELPIETHTMAGVEYVACFDVLLFEVNPKAVKKLYKSKEAQAVLRSANALPFRDFKDKLKNASGGLVSAQLTVKDARTGDIVVKDD